MKKFVSIVMLLMAVVLFSCGPTSKKGAWTDADKERFQNEMGTVDLSGLGELKQQYLDCYYKKLEANFESFDDADQDVTTCEKLAMECQDEVMPLSTKGNWSDLDKKAFDDAMAEVDLEGIGDMRAQYVECYFNKVQANYASYEEANQDADGLEKLAEECAEGLVK